MVYSYQINGVVLHTGDIICTNNGKAEILPGQFWRLVGRLIPGEVDHVAIFTGPAGRCVEAGARGVATFEVPDGIWDAGRMAFERGPLIDSFHGVVRPLDGMRCTEAEEEQMRERVASYCLAQIGKPYNLNFLGSETESGFYCSQLAYKAYQQVAINLNTGLALERVAGTNQIIFPQEIWSGFPHVAAARQLEKHGNA